MGLIAKRTLIWKEHKLFRTGHKKCTVIHLELMMKNFKWDWRIITHTVQKEPISWETTERPSQKNWLYCLWMSGSLITEFWDHSSFRIWLFRQKIRETGKSSNYQQNLNLLVIEHFLLSCGILVHYCFFSLEVDPKKIYYNHIFQEFP